MPGANFDFAVLAFHVPRCGLAAKQAVTVKNESAAAIATIRVFMAAIPAEWLAPVNRESDV
jgi:3-hydroxy-3-methylglutaryl CoA synthase